MTRIIDKVVFHEQTNHAKNASVTGVRKKQERNKRTTGLSVVSDDDDEAGWTAGAAGTGAGAGGAA